MIGFMFLKDPCGSSVETGLQEAALRAEHHLGGNCRDPGEKMVVAVKMEKSRQIPAVGIYFRGTTDRRRWMDWMDGGVGGEDGETGREVGCWWVGGPKGQVWVC